MIKSGIKRLTAVILAFIITVTCFSAVNMQISKAAGIFVTGTGAKNSPYMITSVAELESFANSVNGGNTYAGKYIALGSDLLFEPNFGGTNNTSVTNHTAIGTPTNQFQGNFNGGGHTVTGMYIDGTDDYQGLFGYIGTEATVRDTILLNPYVVGRNDIGGIVGYSNGTVINCDVKTVSFSRPFMLNTDGEEAASSLDYARKTNVGITVDGRFTENCWKDDWTVIDSLVEPLNLQDYSSKYCDFSYSYSMLWDNNALYFAFSTSVIPLTGDSIRLWLDPSNHDGLFSATNCDAILDFTYNGGTGNNTSISISRAGSGTLTHTNGVTAGAVANEHSLEIEVRIPFTYMGINPVSGHEIGLICTAFFGDSTGTKRPAGEGFGILHSMNYRTMQQQPYYYTSTSCYETVRLLYGTSGKANLYVPDGGTVISKKDFSFSWTDISYATEYYVNFRDLTDDTVVAGFEGGKRCSENKMTIDGGVLIEGHQYRIAVKAAAGNAYPGWEKWYSSYLMISVVSGDVIGNSEVGGIVGCSLGTVTGCGSSANVYGTSYHGRITGKELLGTVDGVDIYNLIDTLGASVRVNGINGIRFGAAVYKNDFYDYLYSPDNSSISKIEYGMLLLPSYLLDNNELTVDNYSEYNAIKLIAKKFLSEDDEKFVYTCVLTGIPTNFYDKDITVRPFVTYTFTNKKQFTQYSTEWTRSYYSVSEMLLDGMTPTPPTQILTIISKVWWARLILTIRLYIYRLTTDLWT